MFTQVKKRRPPTATATRASCHKARHNRRGLPHPRRRVSSGGALLSSSVSDGPLCRLLFNLFTADNVNNTFCILLKYVPRTHTYAGATLLLTTALDKHEIYIYLSAKYELCTRSCYSIQTKITLQTWQMGHKQCMDYGTERVK